MRCGHLRRRRLLGEAHWAAVPRLLGPRLVALVRGLGVEARHTLPHRPLARERLVVDREERGLAEELNLRRVEPVLAKDELQHRAID